MTTAYTDGACRGNPGPGGWAWAVSADHYASGAEAHTTNQRMELRAVLEALGTLGPQDLEIVSDSSYVVKCFHDRWYVGWQRRGWRNSQGRAVANRDLWEPLVDQVVAARGTIRFRWVKGHAGDPMNELVDALATTAADRQAGVARPPISPA